MDKKQKEAEAKSPPGKSQQKSTHQPEDDKRGKLSFTTSIRNLLHYAQDKMPSNSPSSPAIVSAREESSETKQMTESKRKQFQRSNSTGTMPAVIQPKRTVVVTPSEQSDAALIASAESPRPRSNSSSRGGSSIVKRTSVPPTTSPTGSRIRRLSADPIALVPDPRKIPSPGPDSSEVDAIFLKSQSSSDNSKIPQATTSADQLHKCQSGNTAASPSASSPDTITRQASGDTLPKSEKHEKAHKKSRKSELLRLLAEREATIHMQQLKIEALQREVEKLTPSSVQRVPTLTNVNTSATLSPPRSPREDANVATIQSKSADSATDSMVISNSSSISNAGSARGKLQGHRRAPSDTDVHRRTVTKESKDSPSSSHLLIENSELRKKSAPTANTDRDRIQSAQIAQSGSSSMHQSGGSPGSKKLHSSTFLGRLLPGSGSNRSSGTGTPTTGEPNDEARHVHALEMEVAALRQQLRQTQNLLYAEQNRTPEQREVAISRGRISTIHMTSSSIPSSGSVDLLTNPNTISLRQGKSNSKRLTPSPSINAITSASSSSAPSSPLVPFNLSTNPSVLPTSHSSTLLAASSAPATPTLGSPQTSMANLMTPPTQPTGAIFGQPLEVAMRSEYFGRFLLKLLGHLDTQASFVSDLFSLNVFTDPRLLAVKNAVDKEQEYDLNSEEPRVSGALLRLFLLELPLPLLAQDLIGPIIASSHVDDSHSRAATLYILLWTHLAGHARQLLWALLEFFNTLISQHPGSFINRGTTPTPNSGASSGVTTGGSVPSALSGSHSNSSSPGSTSYSPSSKGSGSGGGVSPLNLAALAPTPAMPPLSPKAPPVSIMSPRDCLSSIFASSLFGVPDSDQSHAQSALRCLIKNFPQMHTFDKLLTFTVNEEGVWLVKTASLPQCVDVMLDSNYYGEDFVSLMIATHTLAVSSAALAEQLTARFLALPQAVERHKAWHHAAYLRIQHIFNTWLTTSLAADVGSNADECRRVLVRLLEHPNSLRFAEPTHSLLVQFIKPSSKKGRLGELEDRNVERRPSFDSSPFPGVKLRVEPNALRLSKQNAEIVAQQITLIDSELFREIPLWEFLTKQKSPPKLTAMVEKFNLWGRWVSGEVVSKSDVSERAEVLTAAIQLAHFCRKLNNFSGAYAIFCGLNFSSITRLRITWEKVPKKQIVQLKKLEQTFLMDSNYKVLRYEMRSTVGPLVPYIGLYTKLFTALDEVAPTRLDNDVINVEKLRSIWKMGDEIGKYQRCEYQSLSLDASVRAGLKHIQPQSEEQLFEASLQAEPRIQSMKEPFNS